jgi:hypothetical protein
VTIGFPFNRIITTAVRSIDCPRVSIVRRSKIESTTTSFMLTKLVDWLALECIWNFNCFIGSFKDLNQPIRKQYLFSDWLKFSKQKQWLLLDVSINWWKTVQIVNFGFKLNCPNYFFQIEIFTHHIWFTSFEWKVDSLDSTEETEGLIKIF